MFRVAYIGFTQQQVYDHAPALAPEADDDRVIAAACFPDFLTFLIIFNTKPAEEWPTVVYTQDPASLPPLVSMRRRALDPSERERNKYRFDIRYRPLIRISE